MSVLKKGMLCYIKNAFHAPNNGKVVTLVFHIGVIKGQTPKGVEEMDCWQIDKDLPTFGGVSTCIARVDQLLPILPDGLNDEEDVFSSKPLSYEKEKENESVH